MVALALTGWLTAGCATAGPSPDLQSSPPAGHESFAETGLTGEWDISDGDLEFSVVLDCRGTGRYEWQDGRIATMVVRGPYWSGVWQQPGNDREGGFALVLSEDQTKAEGRWWYTRIGDQPMAPSEGGGTFYLTRPPGSDQAAAHTDTHCAGFASRPDQEPPAQP
jgi:hypothetical protein